MTASPPQYDHRDWKQIVSDLGSLLRLKTTITAIKRFERVEEMEAVPRIRRPSAIHTTDQIVSMAARLGWTVGITRADLVGDQCGAIVGLVDDDAWRDNTSAAGVWHLRVEDAAARQRALHAPPAGRFKAMAVSPLETGRLDPPDIVLVYATPGQMILLINALQWTGYEAFHWSVVGESACADSWGRALATDKPSLSLPCYAERRYGGVPDDEMLMAMPPRYLPLAIEGLRALAKNGLRYPIPPYGIQSDVRAGMSVSYAVPAKG
jgi:uncharacterized protein (DUF169 family)